MMQRRIRLGWLVLWLVLVGCQTDLPEPPAEKPTVPKGYMDRLEIHVDDRVLSFGPFVGYYFKPSSGDDLSQLDFVCFNERSFYTRDLPANALLYRGNARWQRLPDEQAPIPADGRRILPVFFFSGARCLVEIAAGADRRVCPFSLGPRRSGGCVLWLLAQAHGEGPVHL